MDSSIVQEHDRPGLQGEFEKPHYTTRIPLNSIKTPAVPQNHLQSKRLKGSSHEGVVMTRRWSEQARGAAGEFGQGLLAAGDLPPHGTGQQAPEATCGMRLAMVANHMARRRDGAHDFRVTPGLVAYEEKAGMYLVTRETFQQ